MCFGLSGGEVIMDPLALHNSETNVSFPIINNMAGREEY